MKVSKNALERQECADSGSAMKKKEEDRKRGDGSNVRAKTNAHDKKVLGENDREHQETAGAIKPGKKSRKPDREFYQPGSRRNNLGKDCGAVDKPLSRNQEQNSEPESHLSTETRERNEKKSIPKQGGKDKARAVQETVTLSNHNEDTREQGRQNGKTPLLPVDASLDKITSKVEKLNLKEKGKTEHANKGRGEKSHKERRGRAEETKDEERTDKKDKGSCRRKGVERQKEKNLESKRGDEAGRDGKNNQRKTEKEKDQRAPDADGRKNEKTKETHQSKRKDKYRENRKINDSSCRDGEKAAKVDIHLDKAAGQGDRYRSNVNNSTPSSRRYSKSDVRHLRNRTYSSSSASSVTSQDDPRRHMDTDSAKWPHRDTGQKKKGGIDNEEKRRHLQSWTSNKDSSSESLDRTGMSDREEDKRRRQRRRVGEDETSTGRQNEEGRAPKSNKGGGRGILRVSLEKKSGTSSHSGEAQNCKQAPAPRGRGGILVLPTRTDVSNSPEVGQRLLSGGVRGGTAGRNRGGRGGGVRRLWDPNNPDQKPALSNTQASQYSSLKQPVFLQTGAGYGQLHFLDTDDEVAGSPPVTQGEHFPSQQAAAMAYYKFQNSDNPYCYPVSNTSPHNTTSPRYPYPYNIGSYQLAHPNGIYPGPGPFCGAYRGAGYSQPGAGGGLTFEEAEQQTRGELGRLLKAADAHELQLSNLLSRDRLSADGLDRMPQLR